ncbi:MAG: hypothetical protein ACI9O6_003267, partial [Glaciecola sp.]
EVKRISGNGSVGFPHVRVAHRQAPIRRTRPSDGFFYVCKKVDCTNRHPLKVNTRHLITDRHPRAGEDPPHYIANIKIAPVRLLNVQRDPRLREDDGV